LPNAAINGLPLPPALVGALRGGRWIAPAREKLRAAFPLEKVVQAVFYDVQGMQRENEGWCNETQYAYLGERDSFTRRGDIDPSRSVLIGDLGPDRLIALDYRVSRERPSVVCLTGGERPRWVEAARDIENLLEVLGL
jgi:hypothetical protein